MQHREVWKDGQTLDIHEVLNIPRPLDSKYS